MSRTTNQIARYARTMAPHGTHMSGSGRRKRGVPLAASIYSNLSIGQRYVVGKAGSRKNYATTVHQGSSQHIIRGRGKLLKFRWERGSLLLAHRGHGHREFFYFPAVTHPGNKRPVRYLTTPLSLVARRNGFMVFGVGRGRGRLP